MTTGNAPAEGLSSSPQKRPPEFSSYTRVVLSIAALTAAVVAGILAAKRGRYFDAAKQVVPPAVAAPSSPSPVGEFLTPPQAPHPEASVEEVSVRVQVPIELDAFLRTPVGHIPCEKLPVFEAYVRAYSSILEDFVRTSIEEGATSPMLRAWEQFFDDLEKRYMSEREAHDRKHREVGQELHKRAA